MGAGVRRSRQGNKPSEMWMKEQKIHSGPGLTIRREGAGLSWENRSLGGGDVKAVGGELRAACGCGRWLYRFTGSEHVRSPCPWCFLPVSVPLAGSLESSGSSVPCRRLLFLNVWPRKTLLSLRIAVGSRGVEDPRRELS